MYVMRPHWPSLVREDANDRLEHPVVSAVPGPDWRPRLLGDAVVSAIVGTGTLDAINPAPFQQGLQGTRRVGMVSVRSMSRTELIRVRRVRLRFRREADGLTQKEEAPEFRGMKMILEGFCSGSGR
jgi:hypothetical protein